LEIKNNVHNDINNDIDSVATEIENCTWNHQEQSNRLDDGEEHENNILQLNRTMWLQNNVTCQIIKS